MLIAKSLKGERAAGCCDFTGRGRLPLSRITRGMAQGFVISIAKTLMVPSAAF